MTDADSIWKGKMSRLQDPNLEKMKPLVELMGELRERRQERGEHRSHAPGAQEGVEHDADTLRSGSGDVDRRPQEGVRRPWWRRVLWG